MSQENSIFNGAATPAPAEATNPVVNSPVTPTVTPDLAEFVGTGKKYASVDEALKSVPHAQKHILTLQEELAKAKEELEKRKTAEAILEEIKSAGSQTTTAQPAVENKTNPEEIQRIVQQTIEQKEYQVKTATNVETVKNNFISKFGDAAEKEYIRIAEEAGLSIAELNRLSATSPNAVLKLAGLTSQTKTVSKPTSSVNTEVFSSNNNVQNQSTLSARVGPGASSTKDVLNAWKIAGQKVGRSY